MGTSRVRRRLNVVAPPNRHESTPHESPEPSPPAESSEAPQPDNADPDSAYPDIDAVSTGMALLLHLALRLMKSYDASPIRKDRGRER